MKVVVILQHLCPECLAPFILVAAWKLGYDKLKEVPQEVCSNALVHTVQPIDPEYCILHTGDRKQWANFMTSGQHLCQEVCSGEPVAPPGGS